MIVKRQGAETCGKSDLRTYKFTWNRCAGRKVYRPVMERNKSKKIQVHRSVKIRMEAGPAPKSRKKNHTFRRYNSLPWMAN